jgi:hypothetical protein
MHQSPEGSGSRLLVSNLGNLVAHGAQSSAHPATAQARLVLDASVEEDDQGERCDLAAPGYRNAMAQRQSCSNTRASGEAEAWLDRFSGEIFDAWDDDHRSAPACANSRAAAHPATLPPTTATSNLRANARPESAMSWSL